MKITTLPLYEMKAGQIDIEAFQQTVLEYGYAVVRNENAQIEDFMEFSELIGHHFFIQGKEAGQYRCIGGNSGRHKIGDHSGLYIETGKDQTHAVPLHGELYFQFPAPPQVLWGYCYTTGHSERGELLLCDTLELFKAFSPSVQELLIKHKIKYVRQHSEEVWKQIYLTDNFEELKQHFEALGVECELSEDQSIKTTFTCSALRDYGGLPAFVNNIYPFGYRQTFNIEESKARLYLDNGELFPREVFSEIWEVAQKLTFGWEWQTGDIILVDNTRMMHGREKIQIPGREILVRFSHASFLDKVAPR